MHRSKVNLSGWGRYPSLDAQRTSVHSEQAISEYLHKSPSTLAIGNLRSYGDSALWADVLDMRARDLLRGFDEASGVLDVNAGCLLNEILRVMVPKGWFLNVSPGTSLITVGGAIAADVHGKNHHTEGCFSEWVEHFRLMLPDGSIKECSKERNTELFNATCGGMGLTGIILSARIVLKRIYSSQIRQTVIKTQDLSDTFSTFERLASAPYSVAWLDCLARGPKLGRALVSVGEFSDSGALSYEPTSALSLPISLPPAVLNKWSMKAFNALYYHRQRHRESRSVVDLKSFFYPLDGIDHWNRAYGKQGFQQYQFILPLANSDEGMRAILEEISASGLGSFLAVLKLYGQENTNWLSFPMKGYSLALDFAQHKALPQLLERLDQKVLRYGGRIYLAKDARVTRDVFEPGYPDINRFRALRRHYGMDKKFNSLQAQRLAL